ncbi:MAG: YceI family protein [Spirosomataceae bacterium]
MKSIITGLFLVTLFSGFSASPKKIKKKLFSNKNASWLSYAGKHPFHSWRGVSKDINCVITFNEDNAQVETVAVSAKALSFDSRNTNRDSHALEMIEALIFPKINFTSADITQREGMMWIKGSLNLHGVTRPVRVEAKTIVEGNQIKVEGHFPVKLSDFKINRPSLLFVKIEEEIKVDFHFEFLTQ